MADQCEHDLGKVSDVTRQLIERDRAGRAKYGTTLDRTDLAFTDWLQHLSEELLDGAGYALAAKREALARQEAASSDALRAAAIQVIKMNRQQAEDQYGDANKAEQWACVVVLRAALSAQPSAPVGLLDDMRDLQKFIEWNRSSGGLYVKPGFESVVLDHVRRYAAPPAAQAVDLDARRYRFLRSQPVDGGPYGVPRIAIPESQKSGDFVNEEDADAAVDAHLIDQQAGKGVSDA